MWSISVWGSVVGPQGQVGILDRQSWQSAGFGDQIYAHLIQPPSGVIKSHLCSFESRTSPFLRPLDSFCDHIYYIVTILALQGVSTNQKSLALP